MERNLLKKVIFTIIISAIFMVSSSPVALAKSNDSDSINYGKLIKLEDVEYFIDKINEYKDIHPKATNEEINDFIKKEMRKKYLSGNTDEKHINGDVVIQSGTVYGVTLNDQEMTLYNSNPTNGLLSLFSGKIALTEAEGRYQPDQLHNGNGDAFRHSFWCMLMTYYTGESWAKSWSDAHEYGTINNPEMEMKMDLFNNGTGIHNANLNPDSQSISEKADIIMHRVDVGGMLRIVDNELVNTDSSGKL